MINTLSGFINVVCGLNARIAKGTKFSGEIKTVEWVKFSLELIEFCHLFKRGGRLEKKGFDANA